MDQGQMSFDIINALQTRIKLAEIAHIILQYLDCESLRNAELVSQVWRNTIYNGNLWQKLLLTNISLTTAFRRMSNILKHQASYNHLVSNNDRQDYERNLCIQATNSLKVLKDNWLNGNCLKRELPAGYSASQQHSLGFQMDERRIVKLDDSGNLKVLNRWTLNVEKTFGNETLHGMICRTFSSKLLAIGFNNGELRIYDLESGNLMHVFRDSETLFPNEEVLQEMDGISCVLGNVAFSPIGNILVSFVETMKEEEDIDDIWFDRCFGVRHFSGSELVSTRHFRRSHDLSDIHRMFLDELYFILPFTQQDSDGELDVVIEVWAIDSLIQINKMCLKKNQPDLHLLFHYSNGFIAVSGISEGCCSLYNILSGECIWNIGNQYHIGSLALVAENFLLTCDEYTGVTKIWDLRGVTNSSSNSQPMQAESLLLYSLDARSEKDTLLLNRFNLIADEYQIFIFETVNNDASRSYWGRRKTTTSLICFDFLENTKCDVPLNQLFV